MSKHVGRVYINGNYTLYCKYNINMILMFHRGILFSRSFQGVEGFMACLPEPGSEPDYESAVEELEDLTPALQQLAISGHSRAGASGDNQPASQSTASSDRVERPSGQEAAVVVRAFPASGAPSLQDRNAPLRYYAVWALPNYRGQTDLIGVHFGRGSLAYAGILGANRGVFETIRFRRADTLERAIQLFLLEAARHSVRTDRPVRRIQWE